ncbi:MAG: histidine kinase [Firmicutes bacterium]|nr:histidine kinase [Bacillota bacterium]
MRSIQNKLLANFLLLTLIPIILMGIFSYKISYNAIINKLNIAVLDSLAQVGRNVENEINKIEGILEIAISDKRFQVDLSQSDSKLWQITYDLDLFFNTYYFTHYFQNQNTASVFFFGEDGGVYSYKNTYITNKDAWKKYPWYNETREMKGKINWIGTIQNPDPYSDNKYVFAAGRTIADTTNIRNFQNIGTIFVFLDERVFAGIYENTDVGKIGTVMITDSKGTIVSHTDKEKVGTNINDYLFAKSIIENKYGCVETRISGVTYMAAYYTISKTGHKIIELIPYSFYIKEIKNIGYLTFFLSLICFVSLLCVAFLIARNIAQPIRRLQAAMLTVENGKFDIEVPAVDSDELGQITRSFNYMVKQIKKLFQKSIEEERIKKDLEIKLLQYQINPHFLYNILGCIRFEAMMEGYAKMADILQSLSRLLSRTLGKAGTIISIAEEINNLNDFLYIQHICYNNKIKISYAIEEHILNYKIPNMLLQPLVENAIFHGIGRNTEVLSRTGSSGTLSGVDIQTARISDGRQKIWNLSI